MITELCSKNAPLGFQIILLTFLGMPFFFFAAFSLVWIFWFFNDLNRYRKLLWFGLALGSFVIGLSFWSWAALGDPRAWWGLCYRQLT